MCGAIGSLKSTYAGSFIFHIHRKFLFLDFVVRKRNIFSKFLCLQQQLFSYHSKAFRNYWEVGGAVGGGGGGGGGGGI